MGDVCRISKPDKNVLSRRPSRPRQSLRCHVRAPRVPGGLPEQAASLDETIRSKGNDAFEGRVPCGGTTAVRGTGPKRGGLVLASLLKSAGSASNGQAPSCRLWSRSSPLRVHPVAVRPRTQGKPSMVFKYTSVECRFTTSNAGQRSQNEIQQSYGHGHRLENLTHDPGNWPHRHVEGAEARSASYTQGPGQATESRHERVKFGSAGRQSGVAAACPGALTALNPWVNPPLSLTRHIHPPALPRGSLEVDSRRSMGRVRGRNWPLGFKALIQRSIRCAPRIIAKSFNRNR